MACAAEGRIRVPFEVLVLDEPLHGTDPLIGPLGRSDRMEEVLHLLPLLCVLIGN